MSSRGQMIDKIISVFFYCLVVIGVLLHFKINYMFGLDDSYITFRYAQNFSEGYGLRFNVDEKYFGSTAMGFALLLGVLSYIIDTVTHHSIFIKDQIADVGVWIPVMANLLSAISIGAVVIVLFRIGNSLLSVRLSFVFSVFFGIFIFISPISERVSGHETCLYLALLLVGLYLLYFSNRYFIAGISIGLAATVRPDSYLMFLIAASILLVRYFVGRQNPRSLKSVISFTGGFLLLVIPWMIFCHVYFGQILPGTLDAKQAQALLGDFPVYSFDILAKETILFFEWYLLSAFVLTTISAIILLILMNRSIVAIFNHASLCMIVSLLLFGFGQFIAYCLMSVSFWPWYLHPVWFSIMMASIISIMELLSYLSVSGWVNIWSSLTLLIVFVLGELSFFQTNNPIEKWLSLWSEGKRSIWDHPYSYDPIVRYLKEKEPKGTTVATAEPGALGFKLGPAFKVVDELGLTSPGVAKKLIAGDARYLFATWNPEYVIVSWDGSYTSHKADWFNKQYELIGEFDRQDYWKERIHHGAYLFKKRIQSHQESQ